MAAKLKFVKAGEEHLVRLDLGAGKGAKTPEGFEAWDLVASPGVRRMDLRARWPWKDSSVDEVYCDYVLQYLTGEERVHFANELHRVLKPGKAAAIIVPHWCANKAFCDVMVQWPPVAESFFISLSKAWRDAQNYVDRSGLKCNFEFTLGYGMHAAILPRNNEYQQNAVTFYKEAAQDIHATVTKI